MHRTSRSIGHAVRNRAVAGRRHIGASDPRMIGALEGLDQVAQPMRIRPGVVIKIRDDVSRGLPEPGVARTAEAAIFSADDAAVVLGRDDRCRIGRAIIDHDDFIVGVFEPAQTLQTVPDGARPIETAHDDRDSRAGLAARERSLREGPAHDGQRELGPTVPMGESKIPIVDVMPAAVPLVGPPEHERARASCRKGGADLPVEHLRLLDFAVPTTVQPDFPQQQRTIPDEILKPCEIRFKTIL